MKINIRRIRSPGELEHERVVLRVRQDADLGGYIIFRAKAKGGSVYTDISHTFWFVDEEAKAGDLAVVYTKSGKQSRKENKDGSATHFFYWGLSESLWDSSSFAPVLAEVASWEAFFVDEDE